MNSLLLPSPDTPQLPTHQTGKSCRSLIHQPLVKHKQHLLVVGGFCLTQNLVACTRPKQVRGLPLPFDNKANVGLVLEGNGRHLGLGPWDLVGDMAIAKRRCSDVLCLSLPAFKHAVAGKPLPPGNLPTS